LPELVEGHSFLLVCREEEGFDKLSQAGLVIADHSHLSLPPILL